MAQRERRWILTPGSDKRGGYSGSLPASKMGPPAKLPSSHRAPKTGNSSGNANGNPKG